MAQDKASKAIARQLIKHVAAGEVVFRDPPCIVTDIVRANEMLPGLVLVDEKLASS